MKLRTIAVCMLAFGVCPSVRAQSWYLGQAEDLRVAERHRDWCYADRERARRILTALQSPAEFLGSPLGDSDFDEKISPAYMRRLAGWLEQPYDPQWDRSPRGFYTARLRLLDERCQAYEREVAQLSAPPPARQPDGPLDVYRDSQGRPVVTDFLIGRFLKAEFSKAQTGIAPWRAGNFTQLDYVDVAKRIEWARTVKRSQGGELLVSTAAMREQFSDHEVQVLNRWWKDLDNAQNGRWNEVRW